MSQRHFEHTPLLSENHQHYWEPLHTSWWVDNLAHTGRGPGQPISKTSEMRKSTFFIS